MVLISAVINVSLSSTEVNLLLFKMTPKANALTWISQKIPINKYQISNKFQISIIKNTNPLSTGASTDNFLAIDTLNLIIIYFLNLVICHFLPENCRELLVRKKVQKSDTKYTSSFYRKLPINNRQQPSGPLKNLLNFYTEGV